MIPFYYRCSQFYFSLPSNIERSARAGKDISSDSFSIAVAMERLVRGFGPSGEYSTRFCSLGRTRAFTLLRRRFRAKLKTPVRFPRRCKSLLRRALLLLLLLFATASFGISIAKRPRRSLTFRRCGVVVRLVDGKFGSIELKRSLVNREGAGARLGGRVYSPSHANYPPSSRGCGPQCLSASLIRSCSLVAFSRRIAQNESSTLGGNILKYRASISRLPRETRGLRNNVTYTSPDPRRAGGSKEESS